MFMLPGCQLDITDRRQVPFPCRSSLSSVLRIELAAVVLLFHRLATPGTPTWVQSSFSWPCFTTASARFS